MVIKYNVSSNRTHVKIGYETPTFIQLVYNQPVPRFSVEEFKRFLQSSHFEQMRLLSCVI